MIVRADSFFLWKEDQNRDSEKMTETNRLDHKGTWI